MTTIKDIAKLADVSIATVSRVLNGQAGVSKIKRQKVIEVATELDYPLNRFPVFAQEQFPRILVLMLDERMNNEIISLFIEGMEMARKTFRYEDSDLAFYSSEDSDEALEQLHNMQESSVDLEGVIVYGSIPDTFRRVLLQLRGKGCPMIFVENDMEDLSPLAIVQYDRDMLIDLSYELASLLDKKRTGVFIHQTQQQFNGEGSIHPQRSQQRYEILKDLYPENDFHIQNKGHFAGDLFKNISCIILDSQQGSIEALEYTKNMPERPVIIAYGMNVDIQDALQQSRIDAALSFNILEMGYRTLESMAQRLLLKQQLPTRLPIFPHLYLPCQYRQMRSEYKSPMVHGFFENSM